MLASEARESVIFKQYYWLNCSAVVADVVFSKVANSRRNNLWKRRASGRMVLRRKRYRYFFIP